MRSDDRYADDYRVAEDEDRSSVSAGTAPATVEYVDDILTAAVESIIRDDYNHIPDDVLRHRLARIRRTYAETRLYEAADEFVAEVRYALTEDGDPEYGK